MRLEWIEMRSSIARKHPFTLLALALLALALVLVANHFTGVDQRRYDFIQRCVNGGGQIIASKTTFYCMYPDGRLEQG